VTGAQPRPPAGPRRLARAADALPVAVLAAIAGAGSFTHIRDTAAEHGQRGPMAWAVAVCIDLTCLMAARERQRDKRLGVSVRRLSWPTAVLAGGAGLSLAANLAQAQPSAWGRVTAAVPCGAFLVAVSMIERRAARPAPGPDGQGTPSRPPDVPDEAVPAAAAGVPGPDGGAGPSPPGQPQASALRDVPDEAVLAAARRAAARHQAEHGRPITRDALRARLGVSNQAASALLRQLRSNTGPAPGTSHPMPGQDGAPPARAPPAGKAGGPRAGHRAGRPVPAAGLDRAQAVTLRSTGAPPPQPGCLRRPVRVPQPGTGAASALPGAAPDGSQAGGPSRRA
jgi:hypothetical protein